LGRVAKPLISSLMLESPSENAGASHEGWMPSLSPVSKCRINKLHLVSTFSPKPIEHLPDKATDYNTPLSAVRRIVGGRVVAVGFETRQHKRNVHTRHDLHVATAEPKSTAHVVKSTNCLYTRPAVYTAGTRAGYTHGRP